MVTSSSVKADPTFIAVTPVVPPAEVSKVHVPVVVNPAAVIVPVVVSLPLFIKNASSTFKVQE